MRSLVDIAQDWAEAAWRRRWLIAVPILAMPPLGYAVGQFAPKRYVAHTTVLIEDRAEMNPFLKDLAVSVPLEDRMEALDAMLHSRFVLTEVGRDLGTITASTPEPEKDRQISRLSAMLALRLVGGELLELTATSYAPQELVPVLERTTERLLERVIAPERHAIERSEAFLATQLATQKASLQAKEEALADYKRAHATELPDQRAATLARLDQVARALAEKQSELAGAKAAYASQRDRLVATNPVLGRIEQEQVKATTELALLRGRYTDEHSAVQALVRRLARLDEERSAWIERLDALGGQDLGRLWNLASTSDASPGSADTLLVAQLTELQAAEVARLRLAGEIADLDRTAAELTTRLEAQTRHERVLADLVRDIEVTRKVYGELLQRRQMARVTGALGRHEAADRVKIIDRPYVPSAPLTPPASVFAVAGLGGGIALGGGLAVLAEILAASWSRRDRSRPPFAQGVLRVLVGNDLPDPLANTATARAA